MCEQARQHAYDLMIQHARELGANAVVGLRYDASEVVSKVSTTEVLCYGTAVVIVPLGSTKPAPLDDDAAGLTAGNSARLAKRAGRPDPT